MVSVTSLREANAPVIFREEREQGKKLLAEFCVLPAVYISDGNREVELSRPIKEGAIGVAWPTARDPVGDIDGQDDVNKVSELGSQRRAEGASDRRVVNDVSALELDSKGAGIDNRVTVFREPDVVVGRIYVRAGCHFLPSYRTIASSSNSAVERLLSARMAGARNPVASGSRISP
jgi:hypothetical protein